jgi:hypothetical protein
MYGEFSIVIPITLRLPTEMKKYSKIPEFKIYPYLNSYVYNASIRIRSRIQQRVWAKSKFLFVKKNLKNSS